MAHIQELSTRLVSSCQKLWEKEALLDCTVACTNGRLKAHKIVLSASSDFLSTLLEENSGEHPTLILDTTLETLNHLLIYLYYGNLPSEESAEFFSLAAKLKIHGIGGWTEEEAAPPTPARRRGRPRKSHQVPRREDGSHLATASRAGHKQLSPAPTAKSAHSAGAKPDSAPAYAALVHVNLDRSHDVPAETAARPAALYESQPSTSCSPGASTAPQPAGGVRARPPAAAGVPDQLFGAAAGPGRPGGSRTVWLPPVGAGDAEDAGDTGEAGTAADPAQDRWSPEAEPDDPVSAADGGGLVTVEVPADVGGRRPSRRTSSSVQCSVCGKMCCNRQTLKVHARVHTDERPFACLAPDCGKSFRQRVHLSRHVRCHGDVRQFSCDVCGKSFKFESNLQRHRDLHDKGRPLQPRRHRDDRVILCNLCGKKFVSPAAFENHVRVHTNQRPFVCGVCQKGFKQKSHLTEHERIHSGQKPFKCPRCELTFYNRTRFKLHQVQHINEDVENGEPPELVDPYKKYPSCAVCGKRFINASNLRLHERRHSNDKPHRCHLCSYRFKMAKTLVKHLESHAAQRRQQEEREQRDRERCQSQESEAEMAVARSEPEAVILLREEEDGSLTYVPGLQDASTEGRVVQVMLDESERKQVEHLMSADGLDTKWLSEPVQPMMSAADVQAAELQEPPEGGQAAASDRVTAGAILLEPPGVGSGSE